MKFITNVLIALLAIYGAYQLYETYAPPEWPHQEKEAVDAQPPPPASPPRPEIDVQHVVCPTCEGEGKLSYADSRGANHIYPCSICNGKGFRDLRVRAGQHVCPDCKGMGVTERREARKGFGGPKSVSRGTPTGSQHNQSTDDAYYVRSTRCLRCNTSGVIASAKATPPSATPGVQTPQSAR